MKYPNDYTPARDLLEQTKNKEEMVVVRLIQYCQYLKKWEKKLLTFERSRWSPYSKGEFQTKLSSLLRGIKKRKIFKEPNKGTFLIKKEETGMTEMFNHYVDLQEKQVKEIKKVGSPAALKRQDEGNIIISPTQSQRLISNRNLVHSDSSSLSGSSDVEILSPGEAPRKKIFFAWATKLSSTSQWQPMEILGSFEQDASWASELKGRKIVCCWSPTV